jgi:ABC-type hemin transport system substrate-binding protein
MSEQIVPVSELPEVSLEERLTEKVREVGQAIGLTKKNKDESKQHRKQAAKSRRINRRS